MRTSTYKRPPLFPAAKNRWHHNQAEKTICFGGKSSARCRFYIDLDRMKTAQEVIAWLRLVKDYTWCDGPTLKGLIDHLEDVFGYCQWIVE